MLKKVKRIKLGKPDPGVFPEQGPSFLHISENPQHDWERVGPHWLHTVQGYMNFAKISARKGFNDKSGLSLTVGLLTRFLAIP